MIRRNLENLRFWLRIIWYCWLCWFVSLLLLIFSGALDT